MCERVYVYVCMRLCACARACGCVCVCVCVCAVDACGVHMCVRAIEYMWYPGSTSTGVAARPGAAGGMAVLAALEAGPWQLVTLQPLPAQGGFHAAFSGESRMSHCHDAIKYSCDTNLEEDLLHSSYCFELRALACTLTVPHMHCLN